MHGMVELPDQSAHNKRSRNYQDKNNTEDCPAADCSPPFRESV